MQVPDVSYDNKPKVGQEFASLDEVHDFYNKYAKEVGFSVRISSSKKNKNDEITKKEYCCFKEGTSCKGIPCKKERRQGIIRVCCNAKLAVVKTISGVNNHGQTIVFACAFLREETTNSFIWLFEQFKKAMPGGAPKMIITDQDLAMMKAIS
ncbi:hypothetical protein Dsin_018325 [Dipteronia sinensis]|uniref:MULE transposase domain-containing protein n=1 Tax=Dipteronia sinensis TaxID=43782 RepID=A0AAE0A5Z8_9ROSI|nr:hypothetical protein Dsin_018325 [Dipteronia sinensis]